MLFSKKLNDCGHVLHLPHHDSSENEIRECANNLRVFCNKFVTLPKHFPTFILILNFPPFLLENSSSSIFQFVKYLMGAFCILRTSWAWDGRARLLAARPSPIFIFRKFPILFLKKMFCENRKQFCLKVCWVGSRARDYSKADGRLVFDEALMTKYQNNQFSY